VHGAERRARPPRFQQAIDQGVDFTFVTSVPANIGLAPVTVSPLFRQRFQLGPGFGPERRAFEKANRLVCRAGGGKVFKQGAERGAARVRVESSQKARQQIVDFELGRWCTLARQPVG
jgi:hypothetical protein